jgi:hypothetical protein
MIGMISRMAILRVPSADAIDGVPSFHGRWSLARIHSIWAFNEPFLLPAQTPRARGPLRKENKWRSKPLPS